MQAHFAESLTLKWGLYERSGQTWKKNQTAIGSFKVEPMPLPPFEQA